MSNEVGRLAVGVVTTLIESIVVNDFQRRWTVGCASPSPAIHGCDEDSTRFWALKLGRSRNVELADTLSGESEGVATLSTSCERAWPVLATAAPVIEADAAFGTTTLRFQAAGVVCGA